MNAMIALLFLAAVGAYNETEMEYHPQAILHYLEMEDRQMAKKVRSIMHQARRRTIIQTKLSPDWTSA